MLAIVIAIISVIVIAVAGMTVKKGVLEAQRRGSTKKVDGGLPVCDICFDELDGRTATCKCGKIFHDSCASPTGMCPYCSAPYSEFRTRESRFRCPNCGRYPLTEHCKCGAILPKDKYFFCRCGAVIDPDNPVCESCGKTYVLSNDKEHGRR